MQLIPDAKNAKLTAVLLLVVVLILVYLVAFHWFVLKHREYAEQVSTQREQLARFEAAVSQRGAKEQAVGRSSSAGGAPGMALRRSPRSTS